MHPYRAKPAQPHRRGTVNVARGRPPAAPVRRRRTWTDGYGGGKAAPHRNRASRRRQTATSRVEKSVSYITPHSCSLPLASRMAQLFMRQMQPSFFIFYKNISRCRYRIRPDIVRVKYACRNFRKAHPPTAPFARTHEKHGGRGCALCRRTVLIRLPQTYSLHRAAQAAQRGSALISRST